MTIKKNIFLAWTAALALLLAACDKEPTDVAAASDEGPISVTIVISGLDQAQTKTSEIGSGGDTPWRNSYVPAGYDIYFTDAFGTIKYVYSDASWNNISSTSGGIRFVNLEGVSAIYITAAADGVEAALARKTSITSSETTATAKAYVSPVVGENISSIYADLACQDATEEISAILYIGADKTLIIDNEPADANSTYTYDSATSSWTTAESTASQYYLAEVSVRPIVSRIEMYKIQALASGSTAATGTESNSTAEYNGTTYEYYVTWSGFTPDLKGIYMSNFYGTIYPVTPSVSDLFATPDGDYIDTSTYLWNSSTDIGSNYNADGVSLYSDSGSNLWEGTTSTSDSNYYVYFDGGTDYCVPFNFFVPFDVTETEVYREIDRADCMVKEPQYHFLFSTNSTNLASYTYTLHYRVSGNTGDYTEIQSGTDAAKTDVLFNALTANFNFSGDHYYANLTSLSYDGNATVTIYNEDYTSSETITTHYDGETVVIRPNKIYKVDEVTIAPYNLATSTTYDEGYNISVVVTVDDYTDQNVTNVLY